MAWKGSVLIGCSRAYLELQVLAPVVPLKQDAALSPALVEAPQGRLVLVHLLQHL